ncbi:Hsp20/alpha crystallin family protein [uncultured Algoriphagus sp.]|uniref:Hsp20/alpha crystallin family protein n=1 Tax=uncultured Algoriphagus sp. TaxID=417365 RepID=UPI0030EF783C|tara:strand:- start:865 stop:1326 length:462 start_codon:yes stop_codon:yes gene_type:complete
MNTLMKRNSLSHSATFFDDFPGRGLFDWLDSVNIGRPSESYTLPRVNISESGSDFHVEMAVPGMKKDDFKVELDNNTLVIKAESSQNQEDTFEGELGYTRREFSYHSFSRSFYLPNTVDSDRIEGKYEDGILRLVIPKREEAKKKPSRTINIG